MSVNESLVYILIQELYENGLFDLEEIEIKYDLNDKQYKKLKQIMAILYGDDED